MTDLVERLRNRDEWGWLPWWDEAAEEFERVRAQANAEIIKLNDALWERLQGLAAGHFETVIALRDEVERLQAEIARQANRPPVVYTSVDMDDLLLRELNRLDRKAEIERLRAKIDEKSGREFELAVLRALARLLWECGDSAGHEALQQLIRRREV